MRLVSPVAFFALSVLSPAQEVMPAPSQQAEDVPAAPGGAAARVAKQQIDALFSALRRADTTKVWDALPNRYQAELEGLVRDFGARLDARTCDRAWRFVRRIAVVAVAKQDLVFSSAQARSLVAGDPGRATDAKAAYGTFFAALRDIARGDLTTLESVREFDARAFAGDEGKVLVDALLKLAAMTGNDPRTALEPSHITVSEEEAGRVSVQMTVANRSGQRTAVTPFVQLTQFVRVDGRWLPAIVVDQWLPAVVLMRARLAETDAKVDPQLNARVNMLLGAFEAMLRQVEQADTVAKMNQAFERVNSSAAALPTRRR